jgi:twitching motility protein PilT
MDLYKKGWISADEAYAKCNDKKMFRPFLKAPPVDFTEA